MSDRKPEHEKFRNLFKSGSREQTTVQVAGTPGRARTSSNSNNATQQPQQVRVRKGLSRSSKSVKKTSGGRNKPSGKKQSKEGNRKKASVNNPQQSEASHKSNRRASKSPHPPAARAAPTTATTPPTPRTRPATPKKKSTTPVLPTPSPPPAKYNGQNVQEKTIMQNTVFENDIGTTGGIPTIDGAGGGQIQLAAARIKERKLQWKKEESDPRQPETSGSTDEPAEKKGDSKEAIRHEAYTTVRDRTLFENDHMQPAVVKEEKEKLQWAPGAATECMSEPAVRKKKTPNAERGAVSDRPPRDNSTITPPRRLPVASPRTPPRTPPLRAKASSPIERPLMLSVTSTDGQQAWPIEQTPQPAASPKKASPAKGSAERENPASCYLAPNMQQQQSYNAAFKNSDPIEDDSSNNKK